MSADGEWPLIVVAYRDGHLGSAWFQAARRARRAVRRGGLRVRVEVLPLSRVPSDATIVFLPEEIDGAALADTPAERLVALPATDLAGAIDRHVQQQAAVGAIGHGATPTRTVVHRGFEAVGGRARLVAD